MRSSKKMTKLGNLTDQREAPMRFEPDDFLPVQRGQVTVDRTKKIKSTAFYLSSQY